MSNSKNNLHLLKAEEAKVIFRGFAQDVFHLLALPELNDQGAPEEVQFTLQMSGGVVIVNERSVPGMFTVTASIEFSTLSKPLGIATLIGLFNLVNWQDYEAHEKIVLESRIGYTFAGTVLGGLRGYMFAKLKDTVMETITFPLTNINNVWDGLITVHTAPLPVTQQQQS